MKKKGEREVPAMSTTSLPDVVYIILFFFMLSTSMRDMFLQAITICMISLSSIVCTRCVLSRRERKLLPEPIPVRSSEL